VGVEEGAGEASLQPPVRPSDNLAVAARARLDAVGEPAVVAAGEEGAQTKAVDSYSGMDPVLAARMKRQQEKITTGENAVSALEASPVKTAADFQRFDPKLAQRMARQQEKTITGEDVTKDVGSNVDKIVKLDPKLAQRMARQQEKAITGEDVTKDARSKADKTVKLDPELAQRMARQQEKMITGEDVTKDVGSNVDKTVKLDSKLAKRMQEQLEKNETGLSAVDQCGSAIIRQDDLSNMDPALRDRLLKQREKAQPQAVMAAEEDKADSLESQGKAIQSATRPRAKGSGLGRFLKRCCGGD